MKNVWLIALSACAVAACEPTGRPSNSSPAATDTGDESPVEGTDNATGTTDSGDPEPELGDKVVGTPCADDLECAGGECLKNGLVPDGYCSQSCDDGAACPDGSTCLEVSVGSFRCLATCGDHLECAGLGVAQCNVDGQCWLGAPMFDEAGIGGACQEDDHCVDEGAWCYADFSPTTGEWTGFVNGYCMKSDCQPGGCGASGVCLTVFQDGTKGCLASCDSSADCRDDEGYSCQAFQETGVCLPGCGETSTCPEGYACGAGECVPACTADSCGPGLICGDTGLCVIDLENGPGTGPGPECPNLPEKDCVGSNSYCGELIQFDPSQGPGYDDYLINGEGADQYRSWARRDLVMLIKWATAYVQCKADGWGGGNDMPLGLGDMSEKNGAIPGTSIGSPGHPQGTHVSGYDMDIAYYQNQPPDNKLRPICDHIENGQDAYHCVSEPWRLDVWRTSLFLGALFSSSRTRVIGVDGKVGTLASDAMLALCDGGWLPQSNCGVVKNYSLAYETSDGGAGWYRFHHHHLHVSLFSLGGKPGAQSTPCLTPDCSPVEHGCQVD